MQNPLGRRRVVEEGPSRTGVERARYATGHPEAFPGHALVAADQDHRAGAHVLLLAHHLAHPVRPVGGERLGRMLQEAFLIGGSTGGFATGPGPGGRAGRHRRRQVRQQPGVDREAAHDLQRGRGVLLPDREPAHVAGFDDAPSGHIAQVQRTAVRTPGRCRGQRFGGLVPDLLRRDVHQLALGPAQRGHGAAEDTAGVEADGVVEPVGTRGGRVTVDDGGAAAVLLGPGVAHRQTELVGLAGRVTVERERPHPARCPAVVFLRQPGVAHHQPAAVQDVVADQAVEERRDLGAEGVVLRLQLLDGLGETVGVLDVASLEVTAELVLVVAGHAQGVSGLDHAHHQTQHSGTVRPPVDEVADEDGRTALRMHGVDRPAEGVALQGVAQPAEQGLQPVCV